MVHEHTYYERIEGEGVPIFLFPTFPIDSSYLSESLRHYKLSNPVIVFDYRNHGKSLDFEKEKDLSFKNLAKQAEDLRKALGYDKVILFAHGLGGMIALTYLSLFHANVDGLVIFAGAANSKYREKLAWNIRNKYSPVTKELLDQYYESAEDKALAVKFTQSYAMYFKEPNYEMSKHLLNSSQRVAYRGYYLLQTDLERYNVRSKIRKYNQPVLLLNTQHDVWPKENTQMIQNDLPHAEHHLFEGDFGHFMMLEDPNTFWSYVDQWILKHIGRKV